MKDKEKAVGINMSDSKTLHSLQVAKMSSDVSSPCFLLIVLKVSVKFLFIYFLKLTYIVDT